MRQGCWGLHTMAKVSTSVSLSSVDVADGQVMVRVGPIKDVLLCRTRACQHQHAALVVGSMNVDGSGVAGGWVSFRLIDCLATGNAHTNFPEPDQELTLSPSDRG